MSIENNLAEINENIDKIRNNSKYVNDDFTLIAVSKTVDASKVTEAYKFNQVDFGENKVQELTKKYENLNNKNLKFHMIGHLQTNKVKYLVGKTELIQSLDRISLLKELEKRGRNNNYVFNCLIQLNLAKEDSKTGLYEEDLQKLIDNIEKMDFVKVKGLMMIAPFEENPEDVRKYFKKLRELFDSLNEKQFKNISMKYLSMGMSHDYKIAIEEGSNMIRIGTNIFGERNYNNGRI